MNIVDFEAVVQGFYQVSTIEVIIAIMLGLALGIVMGAIPGLKGGLAIAVLIPFSYHFPAILSIMFFSSIYTGSCYGGGVTAILLGMPGSTGGVATVFDGYPMATQGKQNEALGIGLVCSAIGCFISYVFCFFAIQGLGAIVLKFGPPEMLMLMFFAVSVIGLLKGSVTKSMLVGVFGLILGTIGSSAYGFTRGTFGVLSLYEGIPLTCATIGILAISQLMQMSAKANLYDEGIEVQNSYKDIVKGMLYPIKEPINVIRSACFGVLIGVLPAAGSSIAATISYGQAKTYAKNSDEYGKGTPGGLIAAEVANNAAEGGAMSTMMAFGVPGSGATALLMAAFMMNGMNPGPYLMKDGMDLVYGIIIGNFFTAGFLLLFGFVFISFFSKIIYLPSHLLSSFVIVTAVAAQFSLRSLHPDIIMLLLFGIFSYFIRRADLPVLALLLGIMLGSGIDKEFTRVIAMFSDQYHLMFQRPVFVILAFMNVIVFALPIYKYFKKKRQAV